MTPDPRSGPAGSWTPPVRNVSELLHERTAALGHRPAVTFYGPVERTELSYATFANWVWKTANLYADELAVGPGDRLATALADHWTAVVATVAAWHVGASVTPLGDGPPAGAAVTAVVADEGRLATVPPGVATLAVGAGLGGRVSIDVGNAVAFDEVLAFDDDYDDPDVTVADLALLADADLAAGADVVLTQGNLLAAAAAAREVWGLDGDARLLLSGAAQSVRVLGLGVLGALLAGGSIVLAAGLDGGTLAQVAEAERVTAVLGATTVPGRPRLRSHGPVEATGAVALEPPGEEAAAWAAAVPGRWVGACPAHTEVVVDGDEAGPAVGAVGVRGPVVMAGYLDPSAAPVVDDGWLRTDDLGTVQAGPDGRRHLFLR